MRSAIICASDKNCADDTFLNNGKKFKNSKEETILGVIIDNKVTFDSHINRMCKKVGQKLSALSQISAFIRIKGKSYSKVCLGRNLFVVL